MARWGPVMWLAVLALWLTPAFAVAQAPAPARDAVAVPDAEDPTAPNSVVAPDAEEPLAALEDPGDTVILSDERRVTRWAHAQETTKIRSEPRSDARSVAQLRFFTEDREPEVYLVLDGESDRDGNRWLRIRVPMRPHGTTGWVLAESLSRLYVVRTRLVVDLGALRAKLYRKGRLIWSARIGIGKVGTPTPRGHFWIRERLRGLGDGTVYGPWAFGTSAYSNLSDWPRGGVVGIHGTNQPELIPGRPSHGCVRVRNDKVRQLARLLPVGTPVRIVE